MSAAGPAGERQRILSATAVMAAGTVVSRLSGFVRSALLAAALGAGLHADLFTIANTVPNMLYILLAGGVFNAVLVPQLVRAMSGDADGGESYTQRVVTLAALFLGVVTVLLVLAAPWLMLLFLDRSFADPALAEQRASVVAFARYCLPQVFFYGMFVLAGQILNARGRFGPMMWAPIANNVIAVAVLLVYLAVFGPASDVTGAYTPGQELLLGLGSTAGIAVQLLILLPYLRAAGFRFRPRFDFRGTGLGRTLRLGAWTVAFVVVNQVAYTVVVRLASSGTAAAGQAPGAGAEATGYTVYSSAFLLVMVPHSVVTVSLATAILPRLSERAARGDHAGLAELLADTLRTVLVVMVPFAALLPFVALELAQVVWGYGATREAYPLFAPSLTLFGPALALFSVHYLMLRGFYALESTRTAFWIQCVIAATNVAAALLLVSRATPEGTAPALVTAYLTAYAVGAAVSGLLLGRRLGGLGRWGGRDGLVAYAGRLTVCTAGAAGSAAVVSGLLPSDLPGPLPGQAGAALVALLVLTVAGAVFLLLGRVVRLREVTEVVHTLTRRGTR